MKEFKMKTPGAGETGLQVPAGDRKRKRFPRPVGVIVVIIFLTIISFLAMQRVKAGNLAESLAAMKPEKITRFTIMPETSRWTEDEARKHFEPPDRIIGDFLKAVRDYNVVMMPTGMRNAEDKWTMEISDGDNEVQMDFYITPNRQFVLGHFFDRWGSGTLYYGHFSSKALYDWYKKYKVRWRDSKQK